MFGYTQWARLRVEEKTLLAADERRLTPIRKFKIPAYFIGVYRRSSAAN
jgi:hypothetical protein